MDRVYWRKCMELWPVCSTEYIPDDWNDGGKKRFSHHLDSLCYANWWQIHWKTRGHHPRWNYWQLCSRKQPGITSLFIQPTDKPIKHKNVQRLCYGPVEDGLCGNDDAGQMSAWYVFSALGFYPVTGSDEYAIGSPLVKSAKLQLPNGKTLKLISENQSPLNIYVQDVILNGKIVNGHQLNIISPTGRWVDL